MFNITQRCKVNKVYNLVDCYLAVNGVAWAHARDTGQGHRLYNIYGDGDLIKKRFIDFYL